MLPTSPLILITDSAPHDIYVSALKYHILLVLPRTFLLEFFIPPHDRDRVYKTAVYLLCNEHHFPSYTVFYIEVNTAQKIEHQKILLIQYNQKFIFSPDNGLVGLLESSKIQHIYAWKEHIHTSFFAKNEMLNALKNWVNSSMIVNTDFKELLANECQRIFWPALQERTRPNGEKQLIVPVLYIDSFNNIILNFKKSDYDAYAQQYDIKIKLPFSQHTTISGTYNDANNNDILILFNDAGYMEISSNGNPLASLIIERNIYTGNQLPILLELKPKS